MASTRLRTNVAAAAAVNSENPENIAPVGAKAARGLGGAKSVLSAARPALTSIGNKAKDQRLIKKGVVAKDAAASSKPKSAAAAAAAKPAAAAATRARSAKRSRTDTPEPMETNSSGGGGGGPAAQVAKVDAKAAFSAFRAAEVDDIDKEDAANPQLVVEYVTEIHHYMRQLERDQGVRENYLQQFPGGVLLPKMRSILVNWLIEVHLQFSLLQETLYLTVAIIDRFLQVCGGAVSRAELQLVGVTAMFIASKYEEMYAPEIGDFVYITDNAYTMHQILSMELRMLDALGFSVGRPLPLHFLRRTSKAGLVDAKMHALAKYILELSLLEYKLCHITPSEIAAASLALTLRIFDAGTSGRSMAEMWTPTLAHYTSYSLEDIKDTMAHLAALLYRTTTAAADSKLLAIRNKYCKKPFMRIATLDQLRDPGLNSLWKGDF